MTILLQSGWPVFGWSLSLIVTVPLLSAMVAPVALLKFMVKFSLGSLTASSVRVTETTAEVWPGAKMAVPEVAT